METKLNPQRHKKRIAEMMPVKEWLSVDECCSYLDISRNYFEALAIEKEFTLSYIGKRKYYKLLELQRFLNENIVLTKSKN